MKPGLLLILSGMLVASSARAQTGYAAFDQPPHNYWTRPLHDRFSQLREKLESGQIPLDRSSDKAFLTSLLKALDVPVTSQMLVFSTTSLQLRLISPSNPRALYFNEDLYVGYIPGGRIEVVSLDPELGGVYFIFDIPHGSQPLNLDRSNRCMNCHAGEDTRHVPGLVVKSVVSGPGGGSLTAYRLTETGHGIPLDQRFGGWYVTGQQGITNHWGNLTGRLSPQGLATYLVKPGTLYDPQRYPGTGSDILPQLLHEHQAGFVNRVVEATYRTRALMESGSGASTSEQALELDALARGVVRYLLFADEVPLAPGGMIGETAYKEDFRHNRRTIANGTSLKDFDLHTRLFRFRCSYMIYSAVFQGLPPEMKRRVYQLLGEALKAGKVNKEYAYLPDAEKQAIHSILKGTLTDLPPGW